MSDEDKVFHSKIERGHKWLQNDLSELISFSPVTTIACIDQKSSEHSCDFIPKVGKLYVPKTRATKLPKVKTVRDVRKEYEKDVYEYLPTDMEKKESYLLKKIRNGIGRNEQTNIAAANILKHRHPVSRSGWQMVMNINTQRHVHSKQFVLWNGNILQVNGSKGGDRKFLLQYDLGKSNSKIKCVNNIANKKKLTLLKNSLNVKFKPGPLLKKKYLDKSFQKYILGEINSITLPKIVLEIEPSRGVPLEPTISNIIHSLEDSKGNMSEKWANYAASALETNEKCLKNVDDDTIYFGLNYKNNQNKILMRSHVSVDPISIVNTALTLESEADIAKSVHLMVKDMLNTIEISLTQESAFSKEDEPRPRVIEDFDSQIFNCNSSKDKVKRKFSELHKLDVTVIRLSEAPLQVTSCTNDFCKLGCICPSLFRKYSLKTHCGRLDCMFNCTCDVKKFGFMNSEKGQCPEWMPGLINLDNQINSNLAKEEKDFHQTVVLTDDKSIVIKSHRRSLKAPKRYEHYYNESKPSLKIKPLTISLKKLEMPNVEPWCMVHSLYQCFCNLKFTEGLDMYTYKELDNQKQVHNQVLRDGETSYEISELSSSKPAKPIKVDDDDFEPTYDHCSRTTAFEKRRFRDSHYSLINSKIAEMEKHDTKLQARLYQVANNSNTDVEENSKEVDTHKDVEIVSVSSSITNISAGSTVKFGGKKKLVAWLEANYKVYKERIESGKPIPLEAPKLGKMALYPWEVILDRYKSKKNFFLVTKTEPYRVFIAVNRRNPFFSNCVGIEELSFHDVKNYPISVRNLLCDADDIKDNFYILCGLTTCWELIGSVTKLSDKNMFNNTPDQILDISDEDSPSPSDTELTPNPMTHSKWLYILVENDFSEIQFISKGFFVKFDNIIKATSLSRVSGRTVRLSSHNNLKDNNTPHFGIYAIPDPELCSVFVGPYDLDENLDIETVMTSNKESNESIGVWVYVNKKENANVIANILQYIPNVEEVSNKQISLNSITNDHSITPLDYDETAIPSTSCRSSEDETDESPTKKMLTTKKVKPMVVHRIFNKGNLIERNKFSPFKILKPEVLNQMSGSEGDSTILSSFNLNQLLSTPEPPTQPITPIIKETYSLSETSSGKLKPKKPVAEIAPQRKSISIPSNLTPQNSKTGMLILKPEEINNRLATNLNKVNCDTSDMNPDDSQMTMDIENFLATSIECTSPTIPEDVMRDVREMLNTGMRQGPAWRDVWIECNNIKGLGWVRGRKRYADQWLSFEFPGFKFTDFYEEKEAFTKINQVLSRKVYIPKNVKPNWHVVQSQEKLVNSSQINSSHFGAEYVLTALGLRHKKDLFLQ